jgi:galactonate dehydratase
MKITGLKVFVANVSRTNFVFVKLYTDAGIDGVGEATLEWKTLTVVAALEELERVLVGRDPFASDALIEQLHRDSYWRTGAVFRTALGALDAALLDIKGKALGVPVFDLLGGKHRERIKCYANHWFFGATTADEYAVKARDAVAMGYRALKWDPFADYSLEMSRQQLSRSVETVAAVRDAVGPDVDLMLDVHGRFNVPSAIAMCKVMAPYDLTWIEEPVPPEAIDALADVRASSPVPIAAGVRNVRLQDIDRLFAEGLEEATGFVPALAGGDRRRRALVRIRSLPRGPQQKGGRYPAAGRFARRRAQ